MNRGRSLGQGANDVGKAFGFLSILFGVSVLLVALIVMVGALWLWLGAIGGRSSISHPLGHAAADDQSALQSSSPANRPARVPDAVYDVQEGDQS